MKKRIFFLVMASFLAVATACARQEASPETGGQDVSSGQEQNRSDTQETDPEGSTRESAEESGAGNVENYESVPYRLYPTSEDAWVGDVMPMTRSEERRVGKEC